MLHFFWEAINSISASTYRNYRLILIDDQPPSCPEIELRLFDKYNLPKIIYLKTGGQKGYGYALALGTKHINAKYVALMNSDDLIHEDRFLKQIENIGTADLTITDMAKINYRGNRLPFLGGRVRSETYDPILLLLGAYGANATWLSTSKWWSENSFFDSDDCLDWRIALAKFSKTKIVYLNNKYYFYRSHRGQSTALRNRTQSLQLLYADLRVFSDNYAGFNLENFTYISTPWITHGLCTFREFQDFKDTYLAHLKKLNLSELCTSAKNILNRRALNAALKADISIMERLKFIYNAKSVIPNLVAELAWIKILKRTNEW